jgi:diguanylate cyclase (GGDEF)-like protein
MTTDMALRPKLRMPQENDIKSMMDSLYPVDQSLILNTLQDMSASDIRETDNLWRLTKAALAAVRNLQDDLGLAKGELIRRQTRIEALERIATTDELTGLTNRRGFMDAFDREMDRTNRGQTQGGLLIMVDMDNFKAINDTYGHGAGDEALRLAAQSLQAHIRRMDMAARLGGDEFVLLFSNADPVGAVDRAQKLARKLNSLTLKFDGNRIPVRASLGIQRYAKGDSIETIFSKADALMYKAKEERKQPA